MTDSFDPSKVVNFKREREVFEELLDFKGERRILTITDERGGAGKSTLLHKLFSISRTHPKPKPTSLISLDTLETPSLYYVVKQIVKNLKPAIEFPLFSQIELSLASDDVDMLLPLLRQSSAIRGELHMGNFEAGSTSNKAAGVMYNDYRSYTFNGENPSQLPKLSISEEQRQLGQNQAIELFFTELNDYLRRKTGLVLLFDAYEKCDKVLQEQPIRGFIGRLHFAKPSKNAKRLLIVIAGKESPKFLHEFPPDRCEQLIEAMDGMPPWTRDDIVDCMKFYGQTHEEKLTEDMFSLSKRLTPLMVVQVIQSILPKEAQS